MVSFISLFIAIALIWLILPFFNKLANKSFLVSDFSRSRDFLHAGFCAVCGLIAGIYPASCCLPSNRSQY
jgi:hypothetical protein